MKNLHKFVCVSSVLMSIAFAIQAKAQTSNDASANTNSTSVPEKEVDYLEWIYFSGENKEGLNAKILMAGQQMQKLKPSPALAKQMNFLVETKDEMDDADNACEVLDLLAAGIYNIDAAEAVAQGVKPPSDKAKKKTVDAVASLDKLTSTSNSLSGSARELEWSSWILNNGKYGGFTKSMGSLANTAGTVGAVGGVVGGAARTGKALGDFGKGLGIGSGKKKKPCDDVPKKDIVLGQHGVAPATVAAAQTASDNATQNPQAGAATMASATGTEIVINNITDEQLSLLAAAMRKTSGITSVNDDNFSNNTSTLIVNHTMASVGELVEKVKSCTKLNLKLVSRNSKNAVLEVKKL